MVQQTVNSNSVQPLGLPNTGTSTEQGDTWDTAMVKINAMFTDLYQGAKALVAGAGTALFGPSGNIDSDVSVLGSSATNTTQTLKSFVMPANTLKNPGQGIMITAFGQKAANAAPVTLQLNVGGLSINTGSQTFNGSSWEFEAAYFKNGANSQVGNLNALFGSTLNKTVSGTDTSVDTGTITISVTMLDASAGQSNVLMDGLLIEFFN